MQRISPETIMQMRTWEVGAAAAAFDHMARTLDKGISEGFCSLGLVCREVKEREMWRYMVSESGEPYTSCDDWMNKALRVSGSWAYSARGVAEDCDDIPFDQRCEIPPGNLLTLREVSPHIRRDPAIQERAKKTKPQQFVRELAAEHPQEHLEGKSQMKFNPTVSQREVVEKAIELAYAVGDATTREEAIECICQFYGEENACRLGQQREVGKLKVRTAVQ